MQLLVFTKDDYPESRDAKELGARLTEEDFEVIYFDADDPKSTPNIDLYDIYSYPSFVVITDDGQEVECWRGQIPLESDLKMFLSQ